MLFILKRKNKINVFSLIKVLIIIKLIQLTC